MKKILFVRNMLRACLLLALFSACTGKPKSVEVSVENPTDVERSGELVELSAPAIRARLSLSDTVFLIVKNKEGNLIPSQLTFDDKLIFQTALAPRSTTSYYVLEGEPVDYPPKVSGRHVAERYGDFAWENDRLGFRFYGKELKEVQAPTSGLDLWYKRTDQLVLDKWYANDLSGKASYHKDHGEGCDPYAVGQTLGGGSMAILKEGILQLNENFESYEVLEQGPLRITFRLHYPTLVIDGAEVSESRLISLDAGSQLTKIIQEYTPPQTLSVGVGFPKRMGADSIVYSAGKNYFIYQEPADPVNGQIFLGVLIPQGIDSVFIAQNTQVGRSETVLREHPNVVAATTYHAGASLTYYTGFGWNKFGFTDVESFDSYVKAYASRLEEPLIITIQ